jgi:hypothetical protein
MDYLPADEISVWHFGTNRSRKGFCLVNSVFFGSDRWGDNESDTSVILNFQRRAAIGADPTIKGFIKRPNVVQSPAFSASTFHRNFSYPYNSKSNHREIGCSVIYSSIR